MRIIAVPHSEVLPVQWQCSHPKDTQNTNQIQDVTVSNLIGKQISLASNVKKGDIYLNNVYTQVVQ